VRALMGGDANTDPRGAFASGRNARALRRSGSRARAGAHTSCAQIGTVYGIPPWGFHTGSYSGESWFAKGHGNINFEANTVSGVMCEQDPRGTILMSAPCTTSSTTHTSR